jgi:hypothetical protein
MSPSNSIAFLVNNHVVVSIYLVTTVRSKPQQNQLLSDGWWFSLVVIGLQGA